MKQSLDEINLMIRQDVKANKYSGAGYVVHHENEGDFFGYAGLADMSSKSVVDQDTIFRLCSLTKPITALAVAIMIDHRLISLDDDISEYIPQFKNIKALGGQNAFTPRKPVIMIKHLLSHTSGMETEDSVTFCIENIFHSGITLKERIDMYAEFSVTQSPGSFFRYSPYIGFDILSRIVEIISGLSFDQFIYEKIFLPLKMPSTTFIPNNKTKVAELYLSEAKGLKI